MPLVLVGTPDRQPRRPVAPRRRGAGARPTSSAARTPAAPAGCCSTPACARRPLLVVNDHTEAAPSADVLDRLDRGERVAVVTDAGHARHLRPGRAAGARRGRRRPRRRGRARPVGGRHRPGGERPADRPLRVRGVPAPQGLGAHRAAGRAWPASGARSCSTRRPTAWPARWPTWPTACGADPAGGAGPRAHQAARGGVAGAPWPAAVERVRRGRAPRRVRAWSWTAPRSRRRADDDDIRVRRWPRPGPPVRPHATR